MVKYIDAWNQTCAKFNQAIETIDDRKNIPQELLMSQIKLPELAMARNEENGFDIESIRKQYMDLNLKLEKAIACGFTQPIHKAKELAQHIYNYIQNKDSISAEEGKILETLKKNYNLLDPIKFEELRQKQALKSGGKDTGKPKNVAQNLYYQLQSKDSISAEEGKILEMLKKNYSFVEQEKFLEGLNKEQILKSDSFKRFVDIPLEYEKCKKNGIDKFKLVGEMAGAMINIAEFLAKEAMAVSFEATALTARATEVGVKQLSFIILATAEQFVKAARDMIRYSCREIVFKPFAVGIEGASGSKEISEYVAGFVDGLGKAYLNTAATIHHVPLKVLERAREALDNLRYSPHYDVDSSITDTLKTELLEPASKRLKSSIEKTSKGAKDFVNKKIEHIRKEKYRKVYENENPNRKSVQIRI